ncbi:MAG: enoyl-ACP reductase FabI [Alphaproteobacteria bacterium]
MDKPIIDLTGKKALVIGVANAASLAFGCAQQLKQAGADIALTYLNEKTKNYIQPLAVELNATTHPYDARQKDPDAEDSLEQLIEGVVKPWQQVDVVIHSIAFAPLPDLHLPLSQVSAAGFAEAMDISCHSFIRLAGLVQPFMKKGGSLITMSYYGAEKVVPNYGMMGPVKAALEATVRYLAYEMGDAAIRVNAISAGAVATRAAGGLKDFSHLLDESVKKSPIHRLVQPSDIGALAAFLASPAGQAISGETIYVDSGYHVVD